MAQHIHKRGAGVPLARWMKNRLKRNKRQVCYCDAFPWKGHRKGSAGTVRIGRRSVETHCSG